MPPVIAMRSAATFSPELSDLTLYVIDVAAGDKIPRKGGPGITKSDLLIINKIDLAVHVGASLEVMERDARKMRGERPFVFTNLKTGHTALVRITDRGPFIPGRVLDLSLAAARKIDVYQPGVAEVKVEVMQTPAPLDAGGKWAVQIGGFPDEDVAAKLADRITRRYRTAKVLRFASPAGDWWLRIRVLGDDHQRAQELVAETETAEGAVFLVRLD